MTEHTHENAPVDCFCDSCGRVIAAGEPTLIVCSARAVPERFCPRCAGEWGFET